MSSICKIFYELGTTQNVEGNMFDVRIQTEYLQSQWENRRDHPELYEEEER